MTSRASGFLVGFLVVTCTVVWTQSAHAKAETLKRAASNVLQAPIDAALQPYTAFDSLITNYYGSKRHNLLEKIVMTPVMAVIYTPTCGFMSLFLPTHRLIEGTLLLPVGAALAGTDVDMGLYQQRHGKRDALVDKKPLYFGGRYCEGFFK